MGTNVGRQKLIGLENQKIAGGVLGTPLKTNMAGWKNTIF